MMCKIGMILTPDSRSKAYLQKLLQNNLVLDEIIFMNNKKKNLDYNPNVIIQSQKNGFDISTSVEAILKSEKLSYKEFDFVDINHPSLINYLKKSHTDFFIFTGGGILRKKILESGPKFIHFHSGIVPFYRGSTTFYYSILNEKRCGVTAYIMDENLDTGDVILQKYFERPSHEYIDEVYDAHIRSETLIEVLKRKLIQKGEFHKQNHNGETYFIIHPVLKHIAILSCINK